MLSNHLPQHFLIPAQFFCIALSATLQTPTEYMRPAHLPQQTVSSSGQEPGHCWHPTPPEERLKHPGCLFII